jgi:hypothetical protein
MPEHEQLDLVIILEIVRYLQLREERVTRNYGEASLIADIVRSLSARVNIESFSNSQAIHFQEAVMNDYYEVGQAQCHVEECVHRAERVGAGQPL